MIAPNKSLIKAELFDNTQHLVVALDGPSASGKGTVGMMLARRFELEYFQSSLLYRRLALMCLDKQVDIASADEVIRLSGLPEVINYRSDTDLGGEDVGTIASKIAGIGPVRENLNKYLRKIISQSKRIIMEGRDIGTVVAPNARLKIFLTADLDTRVQRRYKQLLEKGKECILSEVYNQLKARDLRDLERDVAPLVVASDALVIDTSKLLPESVIEKVVNYLSY